MRAAVCSAGSCTGEVIRRRRNLVGAQLSAGGKGTKAFRYCNLCRRRGFGLLGVSKSGSVDILASPTAPMPRTDSRRRSRLVEEHKRRPSGSFDGAAGRLLIALAVGRTVMYDAELRARPERVERLGHS